MGGWVRSRRVETIFFARQMIRVTSHDRGTNSGMLNSPFQTSKGAIESCRETVEPEAAIACLPTNRKADTIHYIR